MQLPAPEPAVTHVPASESRFPASVIDAAQTGGVDNAAGVDDAAEARWIPTAIALTATLVLIVLDDRLDGIGETVMLLAISATIVLIALRQTLLLRDRGAVLTHLQGATAQANAAMIEARRSAELLSVAEERFRRLVEQIPAAVYVDRLDPDPRQAASSV